MSAGTTGCSEIRGRVTARVDRDEEAEAGKAEQTRRTMGAHRALPRWDEGHDVLQWKACLNAVIHGISAISEGFPRAVGGRRNQAAAALAGLRAHEHCGLCRLPQLTLPSLGQCSVSLVLAYRCGAAPEFHRVPL
jgi:hypothetical protein